MLDNFLVERVSHIVVYQLLTGIETSVFWHSLITLWLKGFLAALVEGRFVR